MLTVRAEVIVSVRMTWCPTIPHLLGAGGSGRSWSACTYDQTIDGALVVSKTMTLPKASAFPLSAISAKGATTKTAVGTAIRGGDTVLILQMKGDKAGYYTKVLVAGAAGTSIQFASDVNAALFKASDLLVVQRVPVYTTVTVNSGGVLQGQSWDGTKTGVLAFEAQSVTVNNGGKINADGFGYKGGASNSYTGRVHSGESYCTNSNPSVGGPRSQKGSCGAGGGGDHHAGRYSGAGGGGGYGGGGQTGKQDTGEGRGFGGSTYGGDLTKQLFLGSGGGGGSENNNNSQGRGGSGGGIIAIWSKVTSIKGTISARGNTGTHTKSGARDGGGAGAGGSVYITGATCTKSGGSINVGGGGWSNGGQTSGQSSGGAGGSGRTKVPSGC